eukprot:scaffold199695_cov24-Tisochrysis_lutea.AAC.1
MPCTKQRETDVMRAIEHWDLGVRWLQRRHDSKDARIRVEHLRYKLLGCFAHPCQFNHQITHTHTDNTHGQLPENPLTWQSR